MPFKSEAQRRYLWANEPEIARDWTDTYGSRIQKSNGGIMDVAMQGGMKNYLGEQPMVNAPKYWQSSPDHPTTELAYITPAEKDLLVKQDLHGSLNGGVNRGPSGIMSLNGWGSSDPDQNVAGSSISESVDSAGNITTDFGPAGGGSTAVASQAMSPAELSLLAGKKGSTTVMPSYGYQPPLTLGQKISQGIGNFASGVGNYLTSGGIWGTVAQGLDKFRDWNNAMQRNRFQKQYERKNPHPMGFVWDDWTEKDWAEKSIDEIPGYREYLTGLTPQQTGEGGGMPLWQQLGYPSYEAWAAQNQGIAGTELDDDVITSDDIALRFLGADRTLNPQAVGLENTDQLREMIQERVKNLYT